MRLIVRLISVSIALALSLPTAARAMTLEKFARMNNDDESTYVANLIEAGVRKYKAAGQPDQAAKIMAFFKTPGRQGGVQKFAAQLESMNAINTKNKDNPNNRIAPYQVEDAMALTMKDVGFDVPAKYLMDNCGGFRPSGPPRGSIMSTPTP